MKKMPDDIRNLADELTCISGLAVRADAIGAALMAERIAGISAEIQPGQWLEMMTPHIRRFEVAGKFEGEAVFNSVGSAAMAKLIKKMATLIDEEVSVREAKQMGVGE